MEELRPLLPYIDYFLPNDDEAERLTGVADTEQQIETFLRHGVQTVIITRGADGAVAGDRRQRWQAGVYRVDSIDPSGSGDAFAAGVVTGILHRWNMDEILRYAAVLGASATTAIGTTDGVFTAEQARLFIKEHPQPVARGLQNLE